MIAWWICSMKVWIFNCGEERVCRSSCPSGIRSQRRRRRRNGGGHFVKFSNSHLGHMTLLMFSVYSGAVLKFKVRSDPSVHLSPSLLQAWHRYYWAIALLFPLFLAEKQIFSCGHMLSWMSKCSQTSANVKIRLSSAFQCCFNVLLLLSCFCSWSLRPSTSSQTRKLWWVMWKKFKILGKICRL